MEFGQESRKKLMDSLCSTCVHGPSRTQYRVAIPVCEIIRANIAVVADCNDYLAFNEEAHCTMTDNRIINANMYRGPEYTAKKFIRL